MLGSSVKAVHRTLGLTKIRSWSLKLTTTCKGFALYLIILSQHGFHLAIPVRERTSPSNFCRFKFAKSAKEIDELEVRRKIHNQDTDFLQI